MIKKIASILESTINNIIPILDDSNKGLESFRDWSDSLQYSIDFNTCLNINKLYEQDTKKNKFCLESILANSMKLSLLELDTINPSEKLNNIFTEAMKKESKMIFEPDFYSWVFYLNNETIENSIFQIARAIKDSKYETFNIIFETFFSSDSRKKQGQFYTEIDLARFISNISLISSVSKEKYYFLDPSCGAGAFIINLLEVYSSQKNIEIIGIDNNYFACVMSRIAYFNKIKEVYNEKLDFIPIFWMDFLINFGNNQSIVSNNSIIGPCSTLENQARKYIDTVQKNGLDLIIGNPPYLRIQNIEQKIRSIYTEKFKSAIGRFDLYVLFIENAINNLNTGGKIAFICSNKFMTTGSGKGIRHFISNNATIEKIYDFTDTEMFMAMVLPCIIVCSKGKNNSKLRHIILTKTKKNPRKNISRANLWKFLLENEKNDFDEIVCVENHQQTNLTVVSFSCKQPSDGNTWHFQPDIIENLCYKIKEVSAFKLEDIADIRVGLKTTCDQAFVIDSKNVLFNNRESLELVHPLLLANEIKKWKVPKNSDKSIIYPHKIENGKICPISLNEFPEIANYFETNREILEARDYVKEAGRLWYEIWVPQNPRIFESNVKIVTPDISPENRFALDMNKYYCQGTCFMINLHEEDIDLYYYILGLLNSKLMEFYHKTKLSTTIYAKRHRYWTSHISKYPIVDAKQNYEKEYENIIEIVRKIILDDVKNVKNLENDLNEIVFRVYGLSVDEIDFINKYCDDS